MTRREKTNQQVQNRDHVVALARGLQVISVFTHQHRQMTLSEIANLVELSRATVRRSLITLQALGYVESDGKYFEVSPKILTLAQAYLLSSPLPRISQPFLERASETLDESCTMSILQGDEIIFVARSSRRRVRSLLRDVGAHLPAYCTSTGRVLLAGLPENDLEIFFSRVKLAQLTRFTVVSAPKLRTILEEVRRQEFCIGDQEFEIGLLTIAVPIRNAAGRTIAALTASANASKTSKQQLLEEFLPVLRQTAAEMRPLLVG